MNTIWLVGASEGIGRALAIELGKEAGNFLILSARSQQRLDEITPNIQAKSLLVPFDVTCNTSVSDAWSAIVNYGVIPDTIITCAGYYQPMSMREVDIGAVEKMIDVNLTGAIRVMHQAVPELIKKRSGHLVLIGSIAGYIGLPNSIGYGASKAGLIHFAENLKSELDIYNIKVQVINPGFVKTRLTDLNRFSMPSIISAEDAAKAILKKMQKTSFESRFPFWFANTLKLLSNLPYWLYFKIIKSIAQK
jgi:short-subunit dehydrogenase